MFKKFVLCGLICHSFLYGEIQNINVNWNAGLCTATCGKNLEKQFMKIPEVNKVNINLAAGKADITLKPKRTFNFQAYNRSFQMMGLSYNDMRLTVRGKVVLENNVYKLVSDGDGTQFTLLNAVSPSLNQMQVQYNVSGQNRAITPEMQEQLKTGMNAKKMAIVTGPLYFPERAPPLILVIESIKWES